MSCTRRPDPSCEPCRSSRPCSSPVRWACRRPMRRRPIPGRPRRRARRSPTSATPSPSAWSRRPTSPDASDRIDGRYGQIGADDVRLDISGARSVVEHLEGQLNAAEAAQKIRRQGFHGCWVIAVGTNDAANVAVGSGYGASERIDRIMEIIGDDPVLWIDVKTLRERGPYASANMRRFNQALAKAHARYPALQGLRLVRRRRRLVVHRRRHPLHRRGLRLPGRADRRGRRRGLPGLTRRHELPLGVGRSDPAGLADGVDHQPDAARRQVHGVVGQARPRWTPRPSRPARPPDGARRGRRSRSLT